jgi:membrane dipeptidase
VDHIEYVIKLVGADHVGIGLDYTEGRPNQALKSVTDMVDITSDLLQRGYSKAEIKKVLGENFLRVFKRVWKNY